MGYISEHYLVFLVLAGLFLVAGALFWCLIRAFRQAWYWGLLSLLIPPLVLYWSAHAPRCGEAAQGRKPLHRAPLALIVLGCVLILGTITWNAYQARNVTFGEREKLVEGQRHLTLTGWNKDDYSLLAQKPDVYLLQMANPDVTNQTLRLIEGFERLEVLDLRDTAIDDEGLAIVGSLPRLRVLYLSRTQVTDEGFVQYLANKPTLMEVTTTGTRIKSKTLRDWKKANPERRFVN
ncbi:MAG: hypothetical protein SNJ82_09380 [Gemmataceae bacterium]